MDLREVRRIWGFVFALALAVLFAPHAEAKTVDVKLGMAPAVVVVHYLQSEGEHPGFIIAEMILGPARIGGFYVGGIGLRQIDGFGTVYPIVSYVGQGSIPKLSFLKGVTVTFAMSNEGIFKGKPAYFIGVGVAVGK